MHLLQSDRLSRPRRRVRNSRDRPHAGRCGPARRSRGIRARRALAHEATCRSRKAPSTLRLPASPRSPRRWRWAAGSRNSWSRRGAASAAGWPTTVPLEDDRSTRCSSSGRKRMSNFRYRGRSGRGELITGRLEGRRCRRRRGASSEFGHHAARDRARAVQGVSVQELLQRLGAGRPSTADLVLFSRQMYSITKAGLPLLRGLRGLAQSTHNARAARRAARCAAEPGIRPRSSPPRSARHPDIFSPLFVSMVRVGESTGTLDNSLPAPVRVPRPGSGRAGPGQERGALSAHRGRASIGLAVDRDHRVRDSEFRAAVQGAGQRHPLADPRDHGHLGRSCAHHGVAPIVAAAIAVLFAFKRHIATEAGRYAMGPVQAENARARRAPASVGAVARDALAVDFDRGRPADDPGADAARRAPRATSSWRAIAAPARCGRARRSLEPRRGGRAFFRRWCCR